MQQFAYRPSTIRKAIGTASGYKFGNAYRPKKYAKVSRVQKFARKYKKKVSKKRTYKKY